MRKLTPELSEILGLLCAEGSHIIAFSTYIGKDGGKPRLFKNDKSERIEFYNKDIKLLLHYKDLLLKEFNYNPKITKHGKVNICTMKIIKEITEYTKLGHINWKVPEDLFDADETVKIAYLRGYFDGDGTVSNNKPRFFSTNKNSLYQIKKLLEQLGFHPNFQKPELKTGRKPLHTLYINAEERERFLKTINPLSKSRVLCEGYH